MFIIINQTSGSGRYITEFQADDIADVVNLPTDCGIGSSCLVLEPESAVFILNSKKEWIKI